MEDLSLHLLDIAENSVAAEASLIVIRIEEDQDRDILVLTVEDNGRGMDRRTLSQALDPFFTTKTVRRIGLGLSLLAEAARAAGGSFHLDSKLGKGTELRATFQLSHIDRQPLGDMSETLSTLIMGNPEVEIHYHHVYNGAEYSLNTAEIRERLGGTSLASIKAVRLIRRDLREGLARIRRNHEPKHPE